jgi:hypothetical protein
MFIYCWFFYSQFSLVDCIVSCILCWHTSISSWLYFGCWWDLRRDSLSVKGTTKNLSAHLIAIKPKALQSADSICCGPWYIYYIRYGLSLYRHGWQYPLEPVYWHPQVRVDVSDCASWCPLTGCIKHLQLSLNLSLYLASTQPQLDSDLTWVGAQVGVRCLNTEYVDLSLLPTLPQLCPNSSSKLCSCQSKYTNTPCDAHHLWTTNTVYSNGGTSSSFS